MLERLESYNVDNLEDAFFGALEELEKRGMEGSNNEPEVTMVIRNTKPGLDGTRKVDCIVYLGASLQEISNDLNSRT